MTVTRANLESILVRRAGPLMEAADMAVTVVGTNADLNDPIGFGIRASGGTVADPSLVTDADVATVSTSYFDLFLDRCELRLLENILGNLAMVDITAGPRSEKLSQLAEQVRHKIANIKARLEGQCEPDTFGLNFAEHGD